MINPYESPSEFEHDKITLSKYIDELENEIDYFRNHYEVVEWSLAVILILLMAFAFGVGFNFGCLYINY